MLTIDFLEAVLIENIYKKKSVDPTQEPLVQNHFH
jgi:hypothetical protein